jgi:hypothetical protein
MGNIMGQNGTLRVLATIITNIINWIAFLPGMNVGILRWRVNRRIKGVNRIIGRVGEEQTYLMIVSMKGQKRIFLLIVITRGEYFKGII